MTRVLITGITGRIGANLAVKLLEQGYSVCGLVVPNDPLVHKLRTLGEIEILEGSLTDTAAVQRATLGADAIVHLAALMIRGQVPIDMYYDINVMGTLRLVDAICKGASKAKRFVYGSTDSVYRIMRPERNPIHEDDFKRPGNYYGTSKLLAETLVSNLLWHHGVPYTILRFGSVLAGDEVLARFRYNHARTLLQQCAEGPSGVRHPLLEGVPEPQRFLDAAVPDGRDNPAVGLADLDGRSWSSHYTDVRDTVEGIAIALKHPAAEGEAFHIVGPSTTEYVAGGRLMADRLNLPYYEVRVPDRWHFEMSTEKASRMLGFNPVWTYEKMIDDVLMARRTGQKSVIEAL